MSTKAQPNNTTSVAAGHNSRGLSHSDHVDESIAAHVALEKAVTDLTDPGKDAPRDPTHQMAKQDQTFAYKDGIYRTAPTIVQSHRSVHRDPMCRLVVFGSFLAFLGSLGLVNTIGTFQAYIESHQLKDHSTGSIGWIFGIYIFLAFFCGVQIGPVFDARGPRFLIFAGSISEMAMIILLGFCTEYWHFVLVIGVLGGVGTSLIFTPAISALGHYFYVRRGLATGIAATGGSIGGIVFPLTLQALFPKIGWGWATRVIALICLIAFGFANLLIRSRLPQKPFSKENVFPDLRVFCDTQFTLTTAGVFFIEWGAFIPITYISSYALEQGFSAEFSYHVLAILNGGSVLGRLLPGFFSDIIGRFNAMIITVALCLLCNACLWLPAGDSMALLAIYALLFGFSSGSNISLPPVCVGQLCKTENYSRYYATAYTVVSFG
ncbi:hypothetical protein ABHI18_005233 [Aspergillus niger]